MCIPENKTHVHTKQKITVVSRIYKQRDKHHSNLFGGIKIPMILLQQKLDQEVVESNILF